MLENLQLRGEYRGEFRVRVEEDGHPPYLGDKDIFEELGDCSPPSNGGDGGYVDVVLSPSAWT